MRTCPTIVSMVSSGKVCTHPHATDWQSVRLLTRTFNLPLVLSSFINPFWKDAWPPLIDGVSLYGRQKYIGHTVLVVALPYTITNNFSVINMTCSLLSFIGNGKDK